MLGVVGQQCWVRLHGPKSLTGFKLYATSANIVVVPCKRTQQVTTLLGPTMLGVVGQQCWVRLHGPKSLTGFKLYATSANKCQHCCGSMQTDATSRNIVGPNNVGCCWPTMLGPFAWANPGPEDYATLKTTSEGVLSFPFSHFCLYQSFGYCSVILLGDVRVAKFE